MLGINRITDFSGYKMIVHDEYYWLPVAVVKEEHSEYVLNCMNESNFSEYKFELNDRFICDSKIKDVYEVQKQIYQVSNRDIVIHVFGETTDFAKFIIVSMKSQGLIVPKVN